jgi:hypothetical protein
MKLDIGGDCILNGSRGYAMCNPARHRRGTSGAEGGVAVLLGGYTLVGVAVLLGGLAILLLGVAALLDGDTLFGVAMLLGGIAVFGSGATCWCQTKVKA